VSYRKYGGGQGDDLGCFLVIALIVVVVIAWRFA
jgi:hypothetical protein